MVELAHENITMICVTHEMGFARQVADRVMPWMAFISWKRTPGFISLTTRNKREPKRF